MKLGEKIKKNDIIFGIAESTEGTEKNGKNEGNSINIARKKLFPLEKKKKKHIRSLTPEEDINYYCTDFCLVADLVEDSSQCSLPSAHEDNIFLG